MPHTVTSIYNEPSIKIPVGCQVDFLFSLLQVRKWNMANISWRQRTITTCPISSIQSYYLTCGEMMHVLFFWDISKGFIKFRCHLDENVVLCLCLSWDLPAHPPSIHLLSSLIYFLCLSLCFFFCFSLNTFTALFLSTSLCLPQSVCVMKQRRRGNINRQRQLARHHGVRGKRKREKVTEEEQEWEMGRIEGK